MRWIWLAASFGFGFGCGGDKAATPSDTDADTDTDADSDADTDADSDADTDADSDADSDTEPPLEAPVHCADAGASMSLTEFRDLFAAEYCWWWTDGSCPGSGICEAPLPDQCDEFFANVACDCIDDPWGCDPVTGEPHFPPSCGNVCRNGGGTVTVTVTTGGGSGSSGGSGGGGSGAP